MKTGLFFLLVVAIISPIYSQDCTLRVSYEVTPSCPDASSGSIYVKVKGNNGPIDISWSDGGDSFSRTHLNPAIYTVTVRDATCSVAEKIKVSSFEKKRIEIVREEDRLRMKTRNGSSVKNMMWIGPGGRIVGQSEGLSEIKQNGTFRAIVMDKDNCLHSEKILIEEI